MAFDKLVQYIIGQYNKGYSLDVIGKVLFHNRYPPEVIDSAISQAKKIIENQSLNQIGRSHDGFGQFGQTQMAQPSRQDFSGQSQSGSQPQSQPQPQPQSQPQPQPQSQPQPQPQPQPQSYYEDQRYYGLLNFVKQQLSRGFDIYSIKNHLLSYGYPRALVERVINDASQGMEVKHKVELSGKTIAFFLVLFFLIVSLSGIFMFLTGESDEPVEPLLDYSLVTLDKEVERGNYLRYTQKYRNIGGMKGFDVFGNYTIQNVNDPDIVYLWGDSIGIDKLENHHSKIQLPDRLPEGDYVLRGVVEYKGKIARAHDSFSIVDEIESSEETFILDVSSREGGTTSIEPDLEEYVEGEVVFVEAIADDDWTFDYWEGDYPGGQENVAELAITLDDNKTLMAVFKEETELKEESFTLTIDSNEGGSTVPEAGTRDYEAGENVQIEAVPQEGWEFSHWVGDYPSGYANNKVLTFEIESDKSITANFKEEDEEPVDDDEPITIDVGGMGDREIINEDRKLDDEDEGLAMCEQITAESTRDDCYKALATGNINNSEVCFEISSMVTRDFCLIHFAKEENDFSVCDELYDNYIKHTCESLKTMHDLGQDVDEPDEFDDEHFDFNETDETQVDDAPSWENITQDTITMDDQGDLLDAIGNIGELDGNFSEDDFDSEMEFCDTKDCFRENFADCNESNFLSEEDDQNVVYEILREQDTGCRVQTFISEHKNETYIDKSMRCTYDNSLDWSDSLSKVVESFETDNPKGNCTGELYDIMKQ